MISRPFNILIAVASDYHSCAIEERLDKIPRVTAVGEVSKGELVSLYTEHMSRAGAATRNIYDQIRNAAPSKKCPLCGVGTVKVLDHHLPKSKYPDLSIVAGNLVPACNYCNDTKRSRYPKNQAEQTIHPYFDFRLINTPWLSAAVDRGPPLVVNFGASPPGDWPDVDQKRVARHFEVCGLAVLYSSNANDELITVKELIGPIFRRAGVVGVRAHLLDARDAHSIRANSWQRAMYSVLATDDWFCNGGFSGIGL